jgi:50S ribosomal subunit-associated GTPase HflX
MLTKVLQSMRQKITVLIPYKESKLVHFLHEKGEIINEEHTENGTLITAYANGETIGRLDAYRQ